MFIKAKTLSDFKLDCQDGELGKVEDFYYDDQFWTIRYMVADTGGWLTGREVLLSPYAVKSIDIDGKLVYVDLTKQQIKDSPELEAGDPLSRQFEEDYYGDYAWPFYWGGPFLWGPYPFLQTDHDQWSAPTSEVKDWDSHLRRITELRGDVFQATDGEIGHVDDLIIDDTTWEIRYFVISTHNWLPGKKVLIFPKWIDRVSWEEGKVFVNLTQEAIKESPEYTTESLLRREYEESLYNHYKLPPYWEKAERDEKLAEVAASTV